MKKFSIEEIKNIDLFLINVKDLATTKTVLECYGEDEEKHSEEIEKLLSTYKYPCLLKMDNNVGKSDIVIMDNIQDVINYCCEYLDCKSGIEAFWDMNDELIFEVYGQSFQKQGEDKWHTLTQDVKLFNIENIKENDISDMSNPTITNIFNKIVNNIKKEEKLCQN